MKNSPEELRQAAIAAILKPAYIARQEVILKLRDGSERTGVLEDFRENFTFEPKPRKWGFEVRLEGDEASLTGEMILAGTVPNAG